MAENCLKTVLIFISTVRSFFNKNKQKTRFPVKISKTHLHYAFRSFIDTKKSAAFVITHYL